MIFSYQYPGPGQYTLQLRCVRMKSRLFVHKEGHVVSPSQTAIYVKCPTVHDI